MFPIKWEAYKEWGPISSLCPVLVLSMIWAVTQGPVVIEPSQVAKILWHGLVYPEAEWAKEILDNPRADIIWNIRLPRVVMGAVVGAGLALSGVVMQSVVRNPLANPYILGISSGASLGATAAIFLGAFSFFGVYGICVGAFSGALATSLFVFFIAFSGAGRGQTVKLLLAGMAVHTMCAAFSSFIIYMASDAEGIRSITFWTMGGLTSASWTLVPLPFAVVVVAVLFFLTQFRVLNVMLMGEETAITMGIRVMLFRKIYLCLVACVTGAVVAVSGTIGFVGLIIPHLVRMVLGADHRKTVPVSILCGSIFLIWCDVLARICLENSELPIGIITGMIGGPFFIYLMLTRSYGFGEN